tara:strand:+ start:517 stop:684 length:168 start_codon:yes stop_codon:yes gene_type:complete
MDLLLDLLEHALSRDPKLAYAGIATNPNPRFLMCFLRDLLLMISRYFFDVELFQA